MQQELNDASIDDDDGEERANNELCSYKAVSEALVQVLVMNWLVRRSRYDVCCAVDNGIRLFGAENGRYL